MTCPAIAIAQNASGRAYYVALEAGLFRAVPHFPDCVEEARELYGQSSGPAMLLEELSGSHGGALALVPLAGFEA